MEIKVETSGERLDSYLNKKIDISRTKIAKMIKDEAILVNNKKVSASYKVKENDLIIINEIKEDIVDIKPEKINIDIVYEDEFLAVINKKSGMVVHPAVGNYNHTLVNALLYHFNNLSKSDIRPGIVHRLDKDTSGLMIVAKNDKVHDILANMIKNKKVKRTYLALVWGVLPHENGKIDAPIGRDINNRQAYTVTDINSKDSITNFKVIERYKQATLVECMLETGRTHQIRVHMNYIGYPIVNDPVYGRRKIINDFGQMLHSYKLSFSHPITKEELSFVQEPPKEFKKILKEFEN